MAASLLFTEEQLKVFKKGFSAFDIIGDGTITTKDLDTAMRSVGQRFTEAELLKKTSQVVVGEDGIGYIAYSEFLTMIADKMRNKVSQYNKAFRDADKDGNRLVCAADLRQAMLTVNQPMTEEDINAMIKKADSNNDGMIDYKELVTMIFA
ncbi:calmodulin [Strongylocentrotus purpuratus]|uniref:EF-hand domain-containing protein n=1 Tax=Strongylocentrotus purpuratus TaxID=7668 RepID=A0A7M7T596_STRPU|nr:calmodulin [Strongylocentrotus purpuratus]